VPGNGLPGGIFDGFTWISIVIKGKDAARYNDSNNFSNDLFLRIISTIILDYYIMSTGGNW
jgi:hypothetical protein